MLGNLKHLLQDFLAEEGTCSLPSIQGAILPSQRVQRS